MASSPDGPPESLEGRSRRFSLIDGMALIAAFAACWVVPRTFRALVPAETYKIYDVRQYAQIVGSSWLLAISVALAISAVLVKKPGGRDRFRQPGALAMVLVVLTWAFNSIQTGIQGGLLKLTTDQSFSNGAFWYLFGPIYDTSFRAGLAILAGWVTLSLLGLRQPSPNWLDRSGRIVGWIWIIWGLLAHVIEYQTFVRHSTALSF
jgi:hypothetical protein